MIYAEFFILLIVVLPTVFAGTDYCDANICGEGKKHIACGNNGTFAAICEKPEIIKITKGYRRLITKKHNTLRNKIAKGFKRFPPAKRMATMVWDDELANLAELNVKQCDVRYDQCRNTHKFLFAGQNLGFSNWKGRHFTVYEVIDSQIQAWFNEYRYCPPEVVIRYLSSNGPNYNQFATMMQDKSTHIGCAILRSVSCGFTQQFMACNYAYDNMSYAPVYSHGQTASECTTGTNENFISLCSVLEKYNKEN